MEGDNAIYRGSCLNSLSTYNCTAEDVRHQAEILRQKGKAIRIEADALAKLVFSKAFYTLCLFYANFKNLP